MGKGWTFRPGAGDGAVAGSGWSSPLGSLYVTQFLSAFADNAIFFVILASIKSRGVAGAEAYMAGVQAAFLLAYVLLAPLVGAFADKHAKSRVLLVGNAVKIGGVALLFLGAHPALGYAVVGIGAVIYSPAKYGILTELTFTSEDLLRANARIEGYTILAILTGFVAGGLLAEWSVPLGLAACFLFYAVSLALTFRIPSRSGNRNLRYAEEARAFFRHVRSLFANPVGGFSLLGTGMFWMTASVLRIAFLAWLPVYVGITSEGQQSIIVGLTAIGIVAGSLVTPKLVPPRKFYRSSLYGLAMAAVILLAAYTTYLPATIALLLLIGFCGGIFIIPMNAALQEVGKTTVGAGKTIAIQNFVENSLMLAGLGLFKALLFVQLPLNALIAAIGLLLLASVLYLFTRIRHVKW